jgi:predicted glycoside hydrolase/deacetylase ChbG (UPF0249 family)
LARDPHRTAPGVCEWEVGPFRSVTPLKALLARAWTRTLPLAAVRDELTAQLDAFEGRGGAPPAFDDGHQHFHLLPGVREVLLELLLERYSPGSFWARDTVEPIAAIRARGVGVGKAAFLSRLGRRWRALLDYHGIARNDGFAGAHDFAAEPPFRTKFQAFLRHAGPQLILFLHPGIPDAALAQVEKLVAARAWEYAYLKSDAVWADLDAVGLRPAVTW